MGKPTKMKKPERKKLKKNMDDEEIFFSAKEVAEIMKVSLGMVWVLANEGKLRGEKKSQGWRFRPEDVGACIGRLMKEAAA